MSSEQAKAIHSITIGGKNTWDDWHLVPSSRPLVSPPGLKTQFVDLPGGDGILDLTEALTGKPVYGNRTGTWEFLVMNDYQSWELLYSSILHHLHGKAHRVILDDDPNYFYEGRFSMEEWASNKDWSTVKIQYSLGPYKLSTTPRSMSASVSGSATVGISISSQIGIVTDFTASAAGIKLQCGYYTRTLANGANPLVKIKMEPGDDGISFTGNGNVSFKVYEGGF